MKKLIVACAALAAAASAVPAGAVTFTIGAPNTGPTNPVNTFAPGATVYNFDNGTSPFSSGSAVTGGDTIFYSRPANDNSTGFYQLTRDGSPATLSRTNFNQVSFYWGSIDSYNTITFLGLNGQNSFDGSVFDGTDAARNARQITFNLTAAEAAQVTGVQLSTSQNAFELDNFIIGNAAVPEPATYGIMTLGLGMIGGVMRRRRSTVTTKAVRFA